LPAAITVMLHSYQVTGKRKNGTAHRADAS
jgi:hypothetical protein